MKKKIRLLISLLILVFLFGCTEEDPNEGTLKVIENIVTYPNEELFDANLLLLPYDAVEERKESAERTESNWSNAVEEYFATNCFDSFIYDTPATGLLACAEILNFTGRYEVKSIELKDVTVKETDTAGNKKFTVSIIVNEVDEHSFETKFTYDDNGLIEFVYIPAVNEFEAILGVK